MREKMGVAGGTMLGVICTAFVLISAGSGCVIADFEDGGADYANGCSRNVAQNIAYVTLPGSAPETCRIVDAGTDVQFQIGGSVACTVCDGRSDGDRIESAAAGPIGCKPLVPSIMVHFAIPGTFPFYCKEDFTIAGAIFVK